MADELPLTELFHAPSYPCATPCQNDWECLGITMGILGKHRMQNLQRKQQEINLFMCYTCRTRGRVWTWIWILAYEFFPPRSQGRESWFLINRCNIRKEQRISLPSCHTYGQAVTDEGWNKWDLLISLFDSVWKLRTWYESHLQSFTKGWARDR